MPDPGPTTRQISLEDAIALAKKHQLAGNLRQARKIYEDVLRVVPGHPEPLTMLATIAYRTGYDADAAKLVDAAIDSYRQALDHQPRNMAFRASLSNLLLARERTEEAQDILNELVLPLTSARDDQVQFVRRRTATRDGDLPTMLINSLPKAASETIWNRVAEGLELAQSHISFGLFPHCALVPYRVRESVADRIISKEHLFATPHNLAALADAGLDRVVVHMRDPRQATLSWAHFVAGDVSQRLMAPLWRRTVPPAQVLAQPIEAQLDWHIETYLPLVVGFAQSWIDAVAEAPNAPQVLFTTFEEFLAGPEVLVERILRFYDVDPERWHREREGETVHLRKGVSDEWREALSPAQQARAWSLIPGDMAERYGWRT